MNAGRVQKDDDTHDNEKRFRNSLINHKTKRKNMNMILLQENIQHKNILIVMNSNFDKLNNVS